MPQVVEKFLGVVEVTFGEPTFTRIVDQSDDLPVPEVMKLVEVLKAVHREHTSERISTDYLDGRSKSTSIILTPGSSEPSRSCAARVASTFRDRFSAVEENFDQHVDTHCG